MKHTAKEPKQTKVDRQSVHRVSGPAEGMALWLHLTNLPFETVTAPGYFDMYRETFFENDRIEVTCMVDSDTPVDATLIVNSRVIGAPVEVSVHYGPKERKRPFAAPWQILNVESDASLPEIERAFKRLSKLHHPDVGGREEDQKAINKAYKSMIGMAKDRRQEAA